MTAPHDARTPAAPVARRIAVLMMRLQAMAALGGGGYGLWLAAAANSPRNRQATQLADIGVVLGLGITVVAVVVAIALLGCARSFDRSQNGAAPLVVLAESFVALACLRAAAPLSAIGVGSAMVAIATAVIVSQSEHNRSQLPPPPTV
jgi:hypothetical protein